MNTLTLKRNGPLVARGKIRVEDAEGRLIVEDSEVYLCRCGVSANKPFCDGAHKHNGFTAPVTFSDAKPEVPLGEEELLLSLRSNAMLIAKGPMQITSEDGQSVTTRNKAALCRCGQSANKPFCDASHKTCGFTG